MAAIYRIIATTSNIIAFLRRLLDRSNYLVQLVIFYLLSYALVVVYLPLALLSDPGNESQTMKPVLLFSALIIAPIAETLIFQQLVSWFLRRVSFFETRKWLIVLISALLFGASHFDSPSHIAFAFTLGLLLMCIYLYYLPNYTKAFWSTALIHFARNLTTVLLAEVFN